jgi:DNA mismatch endonuclease (patch repair protein)
MTSHDPSNSNDPVDATRSRIMRAVRQAHTGPEVVVRKLLHGLGLRFRLQRRGLPGTPDIVLPKYKTAIFVHGCFWHRHAGCSKASMPKTRVEFWREKFDRNVTRDQETERALVNAGWRVLTVWECETRRSEMLADKLRDAFEPNERDLEASPLIGEVQCRRRNRSALLKVRSIASSS